MQFVADEGNECVSHGRGSACLDEDFDGDLDANHGAELRGRDRAAEGYEDEQGGVQRIADKRTADGAHPQRTPKVLFDFGHEKGVGEFAREKGNQRRHHDTRHVREDHRVGVCHVRHLGRVGEVQAHPREECEGDLAAESEENQFAGAAKAPNFGDDLAQHIRDGEDDSACVEDADAKDMDNLNRHDVGGQVTGDHQGGNDDEGGLLAHQTTKTLITM